MTRQNPLTSPATGKEFSVESDTTLLPFLFSVMQEKSRTTVKSLLTHRQVSVNDRITTLHSTPLAPGDRVGIRTGRGPGQLNHPMVKIIYEDDQLIVIDKREGLLSMGTDREKEKTAYHILSQHVKKTDPQGLIFIVHRLDRETSGLMLFAKDETTKNTLQQNWAQIVRRRTYIAVTEGRITPGEGVISAPLCENKNHKVYVGRDGEGDKATTRYRTLRNGKDYSLVELELETGRKNQIRAHLEYIGHPVAGDRKYGASPCTAGRVCLHACTLCFEHPATGHVLDFSTRIPQKFESLVKS